MAQKDRTEDFESRVRTFVERQWSSCEDVAVNADLFDELGIAGDDCHEFMEAFAEEFGTDMTGYLWYFHHEEEGFVSIGSLFFKPPDRRVDRIPISIGLLCEASRGQTWPVAYPDHVLPAVRWDVRIDVVLLIIVSFLLVAILVRDWAGFLVS